MSLDFYLEGPEQDYECTCDRCEHKHTYRARPTLFDANITHNLGQMADAAGIYIALWTPGELLDHEISARIAERREAGDWHGPDGVFALERTLPTPHGRDLIEPLRKGLADLKSRPAHYEQFNASNGWGLYKHFVPFVEKCLAACEEYPDAEVRTSR